MEMSVEQKRALAIARARMRAAAETEQTNRAVSGMSDQELAAAAYEQPEPPPGVTINTANGPVYSQGGGKFVATTPAEAQARAVRERDGMAGDDADALARGMPIAGPFLPRLRAGLQAGLGNGDYASNLEAEQARANTYDADNPVRSGALKVTGAVAGSLAPGMAAANAPGLMGAAGRLVFGTGGSTLPGIMTRGGVAGAIQGAAQGAGDTRDLTNVGDTTKNVATQGVVGALLGSAIPAAISVAGRGVDAALNRGKDALSSVSNKSREWLLSQLNPAKVTAMRDEMRRLGPLAVPADVSDEFAGIAGAAANRPGTKDAVVRALVERDAGKNARLNATLDNELGPAPIPSRVDAALREGQEALGPRYGEAFEGASRVDTSRLAGTLDALTVDLRGPAQRAVQQVRQMLNIPGTDQLDPNPSALFQTRQAIDGLMAGETNPQVVRQLSIARQSIDDELARNVPNIKAIDGQYAELARQRDALDRGSRVFDGGRTAPRPAELADDLAASAEPQGQMIGPSGARVRLTQGARAEIDRIIGNNANDVAKLNALMRGEGDWNREKLRLLFGRERADEVLRVLDAERIFESTKRGAVDNSATAGRVAFNKFLDEAEAPPPGVLDGVDLTNFMFRVPKNVKEKFTKDAAKAKAEQAVKELAALSVAQGPQADAIVQALMTRSQRNNALNSLYRNAGVGTSVAPYAGNAIVDALMERRKANAGRK